MIVPPAQPESLGRYRLIEELGQGGMSVVFRGLDTALEREVAVKLLHSHLAKKAENRQRFHREAKAIARLRHPTILEVYDYSTESDDLAYIVMEYIRGENLRQYLEAHGPPPAEVVAAIAISLCHALEHAHEQGVIHRDLKPENVMVCAETSTIKLMDFGIAHVIDAETMTQTGSLLGSPAYMAPELIEGRKVDKRVDIFSLGTVLYWSATGKLPFDGNNAPQVLRRVLEGSFEDPEQVDPRIGHDLAGIIRRCLASDPEARYPDIKSTRQALELFLEQNDFPESEETLNLYFKNPSEFASTFNDKIIPRLIARGQKALQGRSMITALGCFNRVLAYDPGNREVGDLLAAIGRRANYKRGMIVLGLTLASVVLVIALVFGLRGSHELASPEVATLEPLSLDPTLDLATSEAQRELSQALRAAVAEAIRHPAMQDARSQGSEIARDTHGRALSIGPARRQAAAFAPVPRVRPNIEIRPMIPVDPMPDSTSQPDLPAAEAPRRTETYRFKVLPPAATLSVASKSYSAIEAAQGIELPYGRHILTARSPGCKPLRQFLHVRGPQEERLPVVLEWEDGQINIMTNHDALVWIDDDPQPQPIGAFGNNASLRIPFGKAETMQSEKDVRLRVAPRHDLQQSRHQVVSLRPGVQTTVNVNFNAGQ